MKGFDFNLNASLKTVLFAPFDVDLATGTFSFQEFIPAEQLQFPPGATHFGLQGGFLKLDFNTGISQVCYTVAENFLISKKAVMPTLVQSGVLWGKGTVFYLLLVSFYQEINGQLYSLRNESYNVLNIVDVV